MLKKKYKLLFAIAGIFFSWQFGRAFFDGEAVASQSNDFIAEEHRLAITDGGLNFNVFSKAKTVREFMDEQKITLHPNDIIFPDENEKIFTGSHIIVLRAKKITIKEGGNTNQIYTLQNTVEQAIWENDNIVLGEDDVTVPKRSALLEEGMTISITHVLIKEEIKNVEIDFKTISNEDDSLGWRVKKTTQAGEEGIKEVKYRVVYNDGEEISRKVIESNVTKKPIDEIVTQGTFVKTGKASRGDASYYASGWGTLNASRTIPRGGYAKVTNLDNGKSVIVKINDYGPQSPQRIIDMDYVSFSKIADLASGIAHNVKVEQVLN